VDIDHNIEPFNKISATFVVRHACTGFPAGTIHIIDVNSNLTPDTPFIALRSRGQYYICCDNGIPVAALDDSIETAVELPVERGGIYNFAAYNVFTKAAVALAQGINLEDLGPRRTELTQLIQSHYVKIGDSYRIFVHYIDNYGNVYLGMSYKEFEQLRQGRPFVLQVRDKSLTEITASYIPETGTNDLRKRLRLTVSATGLLELAYSEGSFQQLLSGMNGGESVMLTFN
jgi:S-adenosylmethionine hydrolase